MSDKTTSSTVCVGEWTYIFLNKPATKFIDFIRFKDPKNPVKGVIGTADFPITCNPGPLDTLVFSTDDGPQKQIRVYYIGDNTVKEIKLENAQDDGTDPKTGWVVTGKGSSAADLLFEKAFSKATRSVDSSSFLSASSRNRRPVVVYKSAGDEEFLNYAYFDSDNAWKNQRLEIPED